MNSSTGIPLSTCTFLKTSSAICGRCARAGRIAIKRHKRHKRIFCAFLWLKFSARFMTLLPGGVHRLAHQECRIHTLTRAKLLNAPIIDFSDIKVAFLIDAETVDAPEATRKIAPGAP